MTYTVCYDIIVQVQISIYQWQYHNNNNKTSQNCSILSLPLSETTRQYQVIAWTSQTPHKGFF